MKIKIIETRDLFPGSSSAEDSLLFRLLEVNGTRFLQFQGRLHEGMPAFWAYGILMHCPLDLTLDQVQSDFYAYLSGYGPGCTVCDTVPHELFI